MLIPIDVRRKPIGVRLGSDQEEERVRFDRGFCLRPDVAQHQVLEPSVAATADDLAAGRALMLSVASIWRTRYSDIPARSESAAHHERDGAGVPGEVQRGLPRGVGAADDEDIATAECRCLGCRTPVEHAGPDQRFQRRHV